MASRAARIAGLAAWLCTERIERLPIIIKEDKKGGWTYVAWPNSADFLGNGKAAKVFAKIESYEFGVTCLPRGDGTHFLPLSSVVMKAIGKTVGETITVEVRRRQ